jgi:hypothetical protein
MSSTATKGVPDETGEIDAPNGSGQHGGVLEASAAPLRTRDGRPTTGRSDRMGWEYVEHVDSVRSVRRRGVPPCEDGPVCPGR